MEPLLLYKKKNPHCFDAYASVIRYFTENALVMIFDLMGNTLEERVSRIYGVKGEVFSCLTLFIKQLVFLFFAC